MIEEKYLVAYFGKQPNYYLDVYKDYLSGKKFSFNISPFFIGPVWFLYRKLYLHALVIFVVLFFEQFLEDLIFEIGNVAPEQQKAVYLSLTVLFAIIFGSLGSNLYMKQSIKNISQILGQSEKTEESKIEMLKRKGGVSWVGVTIIISLFALALLSTLLVEETA